MPPVKRSLRLVFARQRVGGGDVQLTRMEMDGVVVAAVARADKKNASNFVWLPDQGIGGVALFFLEAEIRMNEIECKFQTDGLPRGFKGFVIWRFPLSPTIPDGHPYARIKRVINNLMGHNNNLYLLKLFYSLEVEELLAQKSEDRGAPPCEVLSHEKVNAQAKDTLVSEGKRLYDKYAFLGCMVCRRYRSESGERIGEVFFCHSDHRKTLIEIVIEEDGVSRVALVEEMRNLRDDLREGFCFEVVDETQGPSTEPESGEPLPNESFDRETRVEVPVAMDDVVETSFSESFDRNQVGNSASPARKTSGNSRYTAALVCTFLVAFAIGWWPWEWLSPKELESAAPPNRLLSGGPAALRATSSGIDVLDEDANEIGTMSVVGDLLEDDLLVVDLDGDASNEMLVPIKGYDSGSGGQILVYSTDLQIQWTFNTDSLRVPWRIDGAPVKLAINKVATGDLWRSGNNQVIVLCLDALGRSPSCVCLLDFDGTVIDVYWNLGHLHHVEVVSENPDSPRKLILSGLFNVRLQDFPGSMNKNPTSILMLTPSRKPQPPVFREGIQINLLDWYGVILPKGEGIKGMKMVDVDGDRIFEVRVQVNERLYWDFNFRGEIVRSHPSQAFGKTIEFSLLYSGDQQQD